jgi:CRP-like cAMP-binding protein
MSDSPSNLTRQHSIRDGVIIDSRKNHGLLTIHPHHRNKSKWDLFVSFLILYSLVTVPLRIAFEIETTGMVMFDIFVDLGFAADMFICFFTGYVRYEDGQIEWRLLAIWKHYLSHWFIIDLVSTLPIDWIALAINPEADNASLRSFKLLRMVRLLRLVKLMKMMKLDELYEKYEDKMMISLTWLTIVKLLAQVVLLAHLLACFWFHLANTAPEGLHTWAAARLNEEGDWSDQWKAESLSTKYVSSLYWAIATVATVGYGDIGAQNISEYNFSSFTMFVGATVFGYMLGVISLVLSKSNVHGNVIQENIKIIKHFAGNCDLSQNLKMKLRKQTHHREMCRSVGIEQMMGRDSHQYTAFYPLSTQLIDHGTFLDLRNKLPGLLSYDRDKRFIAAVIPMLEPIKMFASEYVFELGSLGYHWYWVMEGSVEMHHTSENAHIKSLVLRSKHFSLKEPGENFGGFFILTDEVAKYSAFAKKGTELETLSKPCMAELFRTWPALRLELEKMNEVAKQEKEQGVDLTVGRLKQGRASRRVDQEKGTDIIDNGAMKHSVNNYNNPTIADHLFLFSQLLIHPEHPAKIYWDLSIGVLIIYSIITVPYRIAFEVESVRGFWFVVDICVDMLFGVDMFIHFRTCYHDKDNLFVRDQRKVTWNYLQGAFGVDFFSTVPFDRIFAQASDNPDLLRMAKVMRILRLARLAKLARLLMDGPLSEKIGDLTEDVPDGLLALIPLASVLFFAAHIIGCGWYWTSTLGGCGDDDKCGTWMHDYWGDEWRTVDPATRYSVSLYWALATMTTVGFGDVSAHASSNLEMSMSVLFTLMGSTVFAYVIGQVLHTVMNIDPCADELKRRKQLLKAFVDEKKLPSRFKWTARQNLMYITSYQTVLDIRKILNNLPDFLRRQVVVELWGPTIDKFKLFRQVHADAKGFVSVLLPELRPAIYESNAEVCSKGESLPQMFFVEMGLLSARGSEGSAAFTFETGEYFGEQAVLLQPGQAFKLQFTVNVTTHSLLLILHRETLLGLMESFPVLVADLRAYLVKVPSKQSMNWISEADASEIPASSFCLPQAESPTTAIDMRIGAPKENSKKVVV